MKIHAHSEDFGETISLLIYERDPYLGGRKVLLPSDVKLTSLDDGLLATASIRVSGEEVQELMDSLWRAGIRPECKDAKPEVLSAMGSHLEDMRRIAFHKLGIKGE